MRHIAPSSWQIEHEIANLDSVPGVGKSVDAGRFSPLELHVITLAEREDTPSETGKASLLGRLLRWVFGLDSPRPLANLRLEQLRRFASLAYHHPEKVTEADVQALVEAGFSWGQARGLRTHLSLRHGRPA